MNDVFIGLAALAVGALLGAAGGYWLARRRARLDAAKAEDVQLRFDDYRRQVTEHFGRTAEHFQAIGEQYRELYEHMASGADTLFDMPVPGAQLEEAARMAVADTVEGEDAPLEAEADTLRPPNEVEWSDVSETEHDRPITVEVVSEMPPESEAADDGDAPAAADDASSDARRTLH